MKWWYREYTNQTIMKRGETKQFEKYEIINASKQELILNR